MFDATGSGGTIQVGPDIEPVSTTVAGGSYAFQNAVDNSGYTISGAGGSLGTFAVTGGAANVSGADINCNVTVSGGALTVGGGSRVRGNLVVTPTGDVDYSTGVSTFDGTMEMQGGLAKTAFFTAGGTLNANGDMLVERFLALGINGDAIGVPGYYVPGGVVDLHGHNFTFDYYNLNGNGVGGGKLFDGTIQNVGESQFSLLRTLAPCRTPWRWKWTPPARKRWCWPE